MKNNANKKCLPFTLFHKSAGKQSSADECDNFAVVLFCCFLSRCQTQHRLNNVQALREQRPMENYLQY